MHHWRVIVISCHRQCDLAHFLLIFSSTGPTRMYRRKITSLGVRHHILLHTCMVCSPWQEQTCQFMDIMNIDLAPCPLRDAKCSVSLCTYLSNFHLKVQLAHHMHYKIVNKTLILYLDLFILWKKSWSIALWKWFYMTLDCSILQTASSSRSTYRIE